MLLLCTFVAGSSCVWADDQTLFDVTTASNWETSKNTYSSTIWSSNGCIFAYAANYNKGWAYVRLGGKNISGVDAYIATTTATTIQTKQLDVTVAQAKSNSNLTINSITLYVYGSYDSSTKTYSDEVEHISYDVSEYDAGTMTFEPSEGDYWNSGVYFKLVYNVSNSNRNNNYGTDVSKLVAKEYAGPTPSISANDVNIAYDATNGSIEYSVENATGNVTPAITSGDWLTLGTTTASAVPFTCSANTEATARTATVTLSFTGATDKVVTITQAAFSCAPEISVPQASYSTKLGGADVEFTVTATGTPAPTLALSDTNAKSSDYGFDSDDGFFTFTPSAAGTFTFTFTATNDVGSVSKTVTVVVKRIASILVDNADIAYGSTYTVDNTYVEGGEITVTSGNTSVATVNGLEITPVAVGKTTITVATAENATYAAGSETFELTVTAPEGKSVMAGAENTTNVTLNKYGYATFCSVNPMDFTSTTGYTAWRISGIEGGTITFEKITGKIKGGQGVLLYNKDADGVNTSNVTITFADGTTVFTTSENKLVGTTAPTYVEANEYYGLKGNKFVKVNEGTVPTGKALLPVSAINSSASEFTFIFEDGTTGIADVRSKMADVRGEVYDLQGRKVAQPSKGLYIVNGKKIVIK